MRLTLMIAVVVVVTVSLSQAVPHTTIPAPLSSCVNYNRTTTACLVIDCGKRKVNASTLTQELDALLSDQVVREHLKILKISNTTLTQVPTSVCRLTKLIALHLDQNRLTQLPSNCFTNMPDLRNLSANYNNITALQDGLFDGLRHLKRILIGSNQISEIGPGVFTENSHLVNLTVISLNNNLLTTLEPWPAILGVQRSKHRPLIVYVRRNRIANLTNTIGWHFHCGSPPTYFFVDFHRNQLTRLSDMVAGWKLDRMDYVCLMKYHTAGDYHGQGIYPYSHFDLDHNPMICDCRDFFYYSVESQFVFPNLFRRANCDEPSELYGRSIVSVQLIEFTCDLVRGCPPGCKCGYRPANATVHVSCPANNFTSLPRRLPPLPKSYTKYKLEMPDNKLLRRLEHRPYLVNTSFLDVSHCSVEEISFDAWRELVNIGVVFLNDNALTKLPREYSEVNISSRSITLQRNPWDCSCDRSWMHDWLNSFSDHLANPSSILCHSPPNMRGMSIMKMYKERFCDDWVRRTRRTIIASALAGFCSVGLLVALCVAIYCLRVQLHRRWRFHPFDRDECVGEAMDYDVFLSCSLEDRDTHGQRLVDLMELKGYRVFRPGAYDTDEMQEAVRKSRRTVCLLSKHFIKRFDN